MTAALEINCNHVLKSRTFRPPYPLRNLHVIQRILLLLLLLRLLLLLFLLPPPAQEYREKATVLHTLRCTSSHAQVNSNPAMEMPAKILGDVRDAPRPAAVKLDSQIVRTLPFRNAPTSAPRSRYCSRALSRVCAPCVDPLAKTMTGHAPLVVLCCLLGKCCPKSTGVRRHSATRLGV